MTTHWGSASAEGTERFKRRSDAHPYHFRDFQGLCLSSIGLGTYLGDADADTDSLYAQAIETALLLGCNVIDTAINYRCQRSERTIGWALEAMLERGDLKRDEIFVCTKGGYLPFDGSVPEDANRYLAETFVHSGLIRPEDIVGGCHCLHPDYLEQALQNSRRNLGLATLDAYYLHNPEQQLDGVDRETFLARMEAAFAHLESRARDGHIGYYGIATWHGLRVNPKHKNYLSLETLVALARRVGGEDHHFRLAQLPYNLAMPEAFSFANQQVEQEWLTPLEAAQRLNLGVVCSAGLLQSRLAALPPSLAERIPGFDTSAQRAIQFVRSTPAVTVTLVGMKRREHVEENMAVARHGLLVSENLQEIFGRTAKR